MLLLPDPERKQTSFVLGPGPSVTSSITRVEKRIDLLFGDRERDMPGFCRGNLQRSNAGQWILRAEDAL